MVKEKSPLLYFYGVECTHCDLMDPLIKQLEDETGMTLRKFEVWYNDDNLRLLQKLDKDGVCNGVPFFYSKVKRDWICGATIYPNFKAWALGKPHERFLSPPMDESEMIGQFKGIFDRLKKTGIGKIKERFEAGRKLAGSPPDEKKSNGKNNGAFSFYEGVLMPKPRAGTCPQKRT